MAESLRLDGNGPATPAPLVVEVAALRKHYRGRGADGKPAEVKAVDGVSLTVRAGELVVLLGPSGCGKTTLLRSVAGLDQPDAGDISVNGRKVFSSDAKLFVPPEDRRIGMMFQSYALWPHMTVAQNVAYPLSSHGKSAIRGDTSVTVAAMLERLGVAGLGHRYPSELSGGQQQRVALARALVASPSVILFDEPLSNVDAKVRRRLRAELRELKAATSFAGIYVTHDQEEAMELADTLVVMEGGRIRQSDSPRRVYTHPASIYVAEFVGEMNRWRGRVVNGAAQGLQVSTELGTFSAVSPAGAEKPGDPGWLGIRPEHVGVERADRAAPSMQAQGEHRIRGVVRDVIHLGARVECRIELQGTQLLAWLTDETAAGLALAPGVGVGIVVSAQNVRWLPD